MTSLSDSLRCCQWIAFSFFHLSNRCNDSVLNGEVFNNIKTAICWRQSTRNVQKQSNARRKKKKSPPRSSQGQKIIPTRRIFHKGSHQLSLSLRRKVFSKVCWSVGSLTNFKDSDKGGSCSILSAGCSILLPNPNCVGSIFQSTANTSLETHQTRQSSLHNYTFSVNITTTKFAKSQLPYSNSIAHEYVIICSQQV